MATRPSVSRQTRIRAAAATDDENTDRTAAIEIDILGELRLAVDGQAVEPGGRRQRSLLAVLLLERRQALSADAIADTLWPEEQPPTAVKMIHIYVSRLRRLLGPAGARITSEAGGYRLVIAPHESDAGRFEDDLHRARELVGRGHHDDALTVLEAARELWRGAALADFRDEPFATADVTRLEELRLDAEETELRCRLERGDDDVISRARSALAVEPYREGLWIILATALYRTGRQADALDAIRSARRTLDEELGLDPGPALDQLEVAILNHEPWLGQALDIGAGARDLPPRMVQMIGRDLELGELSAAVAASRLTTITGPGGTGKTRLALELGWTYDDPSIDVHFVDLSAIRSGDLLPAAIGAQLGLPEDDQQTPLERLEGRLRSRRTLLVLDNLEQIAGAGATISGLLADVADLRIVATSRSALRLRGEREYPLGPLALADSSDSRTAIATSAAVQLFVERMRDAGRSVPVDGTTGPVIAEMCRKLDGLPLAIELAAARIRDVDLASIARDLDRRLDSLEQGPRDAAGRQQTMRGAIAWSFALLEPEEATLFRRMSVFAGGGTRDEIEAVCRHDLAGLVGTLLGALVGQSLIVRQEPDGTEARYVMLETIREYAAEQLASSGEEPLLRGRHAASFLALAERAENELHGPSSAAWARRIRAELDNIRAVVAWAIEANEPEIGLRLVASLRFYLPETGHLTEGRRWLSQLLELSNPVSDRIRGDALNAAGNLALLQGDLLGAGPLYERSLALRRSIGDLGPIAASLSNLSQIASGRGDYPRAQALLEQSLQASREAGDAWGVAATLGNLADVALFVRDYPRADALFREGLTAFRALGDVASVPTVLSNLGQLAIYRGEHDVAFALLQEAERLVAELEIPSQANTIQLNFGHLASRQGDFARARELLAAAYGFSRSSGHQVGIAECLERLGEVLWREGDPRAAARVWGAAATVRRDSGAEMYPVDRAWFDEAVLDARVTLGGPAFEAEWGVGSLLDHESFAIAHLGFSSGTAAPA